MTIQKEYEEDKCIYTIGINVNTKRLLKATARQLEWPMWMLMEIMAKSYLKTISPEDREAIETATGRKRPPLTTTGETI